MKKLFLNVYGFWFWLLLASFIFSVWPFTDIAVSQFFHAGQGVFPANDLGFVKAIYLGAPWLGRALFVICLCTVLLAVVKPGLVSRRIWRRAAGFVAVVVLGIGFLVHAVLKDNMGRPRPRDVIEFSGPTAYVPVFVVSQYCKTNCSFVSGHAAIGFSVMAFGMFGIRRRRHFWFAVGLLAGGLVGAVRIAQGGHFLSDVVFSLLSIWLSHLIIHKLWLRWRARQLSLG
jgi:lipid A 4'-phosphatase